MTWKLEGLFEYNDGVDMPVISSLANPLVKQARALRHRKARADTGLFLVEGIHHVGEVIAAEWEIQTILYAPGLLTSDFAKNLLSLATQRGIGHQPVSEKVMESLAEKENPQGILAIVCQKHIELIELNLKRVGVAAVAPQDPGNVGTILRTLDAVGGDYLILAEGGADPYHPTAVRASMGTMFWTPIVQTNFAEMVNWARQNNIQLIGSSAHAKEDYRKIGTHIPWLLILGSEQKGLSPEQLNDCDVIISLPMRGRVSSLNMAVAAGILLYQLHQDKIGRIEIK